MELLFHDADIWLQWMGLTLAPEWMGLLSHGVGKWRHNWWGTLYFLMERIPGLDVRWRRVGDKVRCGERVRWRDDIGGSLVGTPYPSASSSFLVSCSRRMGSKVESRPTLPSDVSKRLRMLLISSPVRALREMYCWRLRISWPSWSFRVAACGQQTLNNRSYREKCLWYHTFSHHFAVFTAQTMIQYAHLHIVAQASLSKRTTGFPQKHTNFAWK